MASNAASINAVRETMEGLRAQMFLGESVASLPEMAQHLDIAETSDSNSCCHRKLDLIVSYTSPSVLFEISRILNTGLDMETLSICVRLCEQGINPEALSSVIKELRKATEALKAAENMTS